MAYCELYFKYIFMNYSTVEVYIMLDMNSGYYIVWHAKHQMRVIYNINIQFIFADESYP
jgi:hypothetical protein